MTLYYPMRPRGRIYGSEWDATDRMIGKADVRPDYIHTHKRYCIELLFFSSHEVITYLK